MLFFNLAFGWCISSLETFVEVWQMASQFPNKAISNAINRSIAYFHLPFIAVFQCFVYFCVLSQCSLVFCFPPLLSLSKDLMAFFFLSLSRERISSQHQQDTRNNWQRPYPALAVSADVWLLQFKSHFVQHCLLLFSHLSDLHLFARDS